MHYARRLPSAWMIALVSTAALVHGEPPSVAATPAVSTTAVPATDPVVVALLAQARDAFSKISDSDALPSAQSTMGAILQLAGDEAALAALASVVTNGETRSSVLESLATAQARHDVPAALKAIAMIAQPVDRVGVSIRIAQQRAAAAEDIEGAKALLRAVLPDLATIVQVSLGQSVADLQANLDDAAAARASAAAMKNDEVTAEVETRIFKTLIGKHDLEAARAMVGQGTPETQANRVYWIVKTLAVERRFPEAQACVSQMKDDAEAGWALTQLAKAQFEVGATADAKLSARLAIDRIAKAPPAEQREPWQSLVEVLRVADDRADVFPLGRSLCLAAAGRAGGGLADFGIEMIEDAPTVYAALALVADASDPRVKLQLLQATANVVCTGRLDAKDDTLDVIVKRSELVEQALGTEMRTQRADAEFMASARPVLKSVAIGFFKYQLALLHDASKTDRSKFVDTYVSMVSKDDWPRLVDLALDDADGDAARYLADKADDNDVCNAHIAQRLAFTIPASAIPLIDTIKSAELSQALTMSVIRQMVATGCFAQAKLLVARLGKDPVYSDYPDGSEIDRDAAWAAIGVGEINGGRITEGCATLAKIVNASFRAEDIRRIDMDDLDPSQFDELRAGLLTLPHGPMRLLECACRDERFARRLGGPQIALLATASKSESDFSLAAVCAALARIGDTANIALMMANCEATAAERLGILFEAARAQVETDAKHARIEALATMVDRALAANEITEARTALTFRRRDVDADDATQRALHARWLAALEAKQWDAWSARAEALCMTGSAAHADPWGLLTLAELNYRAGRTAEGRRLLTAELKADGDFGEHVGKNNAFDVARSCGDLDMAVSVARSQETSDSRVGELLDVASEHVRRGDTTAARALLTEAQRTVDDPDWTERFREEIPSGPPLSDIIKKEKEPFRRQIASVRRTLGESVPADVPDTTLEDAMANARKGSFDGVLALIARGNADDATAAAKEALDRADDVAILQARRGDFAGAARTENRRLRKDVRLQIARIAASAGKRREAMDALEQELADEANSFSDTQTELQIVGGVRRFAEISNAAVDVGSLGLARIAFSRAEASVRTLRLYKVHNGQVDLAYRELLPRASLASAEARRVRELAMIASPSDRSEFEIDRQRAHLAIHEAAADRGWEADIAENVDVADIGDITTKMLHVSCEGNEAAFVRGESVRAVAATRARLGETRAVDEWAQRSPEDAQQIFLSALAALLPDEPEKDDN